MFVNLFLWPLILVGGYLAWVVVGTLGTAELTAERARREAACSAAQRAYDQTVNRVLTEGTPEAFRKKKAELAHLRDEYIQLPKREGDELATLHATAESRQKQRYLGRQFIDEASIPGVGLAKKATLRSFGIETAADVTRQNVAAVKGFGQVLTRSVMAWRYSCERRFVFDPSIAVTDADKSAVRAKIEARKRTIETSLRAGAGELERLRHDMTKKAVELIPLLQAASRTLAQAQADLRAV
jgi:DNA-binding helix-hairpin-helix protein with protein kinase domain